LECFPRLPEQLHVSFYIHVFMLVNHMYIYM
jgi:hypothetical protein